MRVSAVLSCVALLPAVHSSTGDRAAHLLSHLVGKSDNPDCQPDLLTCITDSNYAEKCPLECGFFADVAEAVQQPDADAALLSLLFSDRVLNSLTHSTGRQVPKPLWDALEEVSWSLCGKCPSVSCCVGYPLTVMEALIGVFLPSHDANIQAMFHELLKEAALGLLPFSHQNPRQYYKDTIQFFFNGDRVDGGWINEFLGTIDVYHKGGVHMYRQAPTDSSGKVDLGFSVDLLPSPQGRAVKIGLIADWGCGNAGARRVLEELNKQQPDIVIHLGDTYYSGTKDEQLEYFLGLAQEILGKDMPILTIPGNHDYYSGGEGMFGIIDHLAKSQSPKQEASFFALRGDAWQILALDTALLDSYQLSEIAGALPLGQQWKRNHAGTLPFLPDDQLQWALGQIEEGDKNGLKTIVLSHHQLFSRRESMGYPNAAARQKAFAQDLKAGTYKESQWQKTAGQLPGQLDPDVQPAANTRLLDQFPPKVLDKVAGWFWGHEHGMSIFGPYAGLQRGRLIGNACIPVPKPPTFDQFAESEETHGAPGWKGHPSLVKNSTIGHGHNFWNLGFVTLELGQRAEAAYFEVEDYFEDGSTKFKEARLFFKEDLSDAIQV